MIEFPEGQTLAKQLKNNVIGKCVTGVFPPTKPHKFCWFSGDPSEYGNKITGSVITNASAFGIYVEIVFDNGQYLCFNDGVNVRLTDVANTANDYQLLITLDDTSALCFTVAMYGGIVLHAGDYDNEYYLKSKAAISPLESGFKDYYFNLLDTSKPSLSMKAFLATEQRFPGIGNGTVQDILFAAGIHPKQRLGLLTDKQRDCLFDSICLVIAEMTVKGGRDTEKDIFGNVGGYKTKLSKNTLSSGCPVCGGEITKENYLGGSVYYCAKCQILKK